MLSIQDKTDSRDQLLYDHLEKLNALTSDSRCFKKELSRLCSMLQRQPEFNRYSLNALNKTWMYFRGGGILRFDYHRPNVYKNFVRWLTFPGKGYLWWRQRDEKLKKLKPPPYESLDEIIPGTENLTLGEVFPSPEKPLLDDLIEKELIEGLKEYIRLDPQGLLRNCCVTAEPGFPSCNAQTVMQQVYLADQVIKLSKLADELHVIRSTMYAFHSGRFTKLIKKIVREIYPDLPEV
jgi:hypothetical protein